MSKKVVIIIGFIASILAVIIAVTPQYNLAVAPISVAFLCGLILLFISKKENKKTKTIQYIFIMVIISLSLTIYKTIFSETELDPEEPVEIGTEENLEASTKLLEDGEIN